MKVDRCPESSKLKYDIADIFRQSGQHFLNTHSASHGQVKVLNQIVACRTAALGGHIQIHILGMIGIGGKIIPVTKNDSALHHCLDTICPVHEMVGPVCGKQ